MLKIDEARAEVHVDGREVPVTHKELQLFVTLKEAGGKVLDRRQLLEKVWGYGNVGEVDTRTVDQHVCRLRTKFGKYGRHIKTVYLRGYKYAA